MAYFTKLVLLLAFLVLVCLAPLGGDISENGASMTPTDTERNGGQCQKCHVSAGHLDNGGSQSETAGSFRFMATLLLETLRGDNARGKSKRLQMASLAAIFLLLLEVAFAGTLLLYLSAFMKLKDVGNEPQGNWYAVSGRGMYFICKGRISSSVRHVNDRDRKVKLQVKILSEKGVFRKLKCLDRKLGAEGRNSSFLDSFSKPLIHQLSEFHRDHAVFRLRQVTVCPVSLLSGLKPDRAGTGHNLQIELGRLITFKDFPPSCPVSAMRLSQAGFYYLGPGDKVKCFSCALEHQGWQFGDKPVEIHRIRAPDCSFILSLSNLHRDQSTPLATTSLPVGPTINGNIVDKHGPAGHESRSMESGYISGSSGCVSAVSSSNGSNVNPSASSLQSNALQMDGTAHEPPVHGTDLLSLSGPPAMTGPAPNFAELQRAQQASSMGQAVADGSSAVVAPTDGAVAAPRQLLPSRRLDLGRAVYPLYSQMDARRRSYQNWQHIQGLPSVDELITLGFFYAGYADCVRCFFCGIGLKSWEADDIPAEVHARWRPTCEYLRLVKGDAFVDRVVAVAEGHGTSFQSSGGPRLPCSQQGQQGLLELLGLQLPTSLYLIASVLEAAVGHANSMVQGASSMLTGLSMPAMLVFYTSGRTLVRPAIPPTVNQAPAPRDSALQSDAIRSAPTNVSNQQNSSSSANQIPDTQAVRSARVSGYSDQQIKEAIDAIKNMGVESQMESMLPEVLANLNRERPPSNNTNQQQQQRGSNDLQDDGIVADEVPDAADRQALAGQNVDDGLRQRQLVLQRENARLREMRMCQRCHVNNVGVIFLPCGHILACTDCAPNIRRCIRCNEVIRATANVYFS